MSRDYVVNSYDIAQVMAGPHLHCNSRSDEWFVVLGDGRKIGKDRFAGHLPDRSDARVRGWRSFADAAEAARAHGVDGPWMRPKHQYMDRNWWPTSAVIPEGLQRRTRTDKAAPIQWVTGVPCIAGTPVTPECLNVATSPDGLCGMHVAAKARRIESANQRSAKNREYRDRNRRTQEATRAAEETLARLAPILEALGYHPGTVARGSNGDRVGLLVAPETLESIVTELAELIEMTESRES